MTNIGKILVVVITAFSMLLLGVSTVAFTTATKWKTKLSKIDEDSKPFRTTLEEAQKSLDEAKGQLDTAQKARTAEVKQRENRVRDLVDATTKATAEIATAQAALKKAQKEAQAILADADARRKDTDGLKQNLAAVEAQAKLFKDQEAVLNDRIVELTRMLEASTKNGQVLQERTSKPAR